jgi:hypothetical protein
VARGAPVEPTPARSRRGAHRARRSRSTGQKLFPVIGLVGLTAALTVTATFVVPAQARGERVTHRRKNAQVTKAAATSAAPNPLATPEITRYLAGQPGTIAAGLYDIDNGETYVYHPTDAETTASVIKVDILATMLYQSQRSGQSLTGAEDSQLATLMIENSDDNAAQELWDQVGANVGVGAFDQVAGLTHTTLNTQGLWGLSTTTVLDQIKVLRQVVQSQSLLTAASRQYELGLMENVEADQRWGVAFGLPAGCDHRHQRRMGPLGRRHDLASQHRGLGRRRRTGLRPGHPHRRGKHRVRRHPDGRSSLRSHLGRARPTSPVVRHPGLERSCSAIEMSSVP